MVDIPTLFYPLFTMATAIAASLFLIRHAGKNHLPQVDMFYWHYAFGFMILAAVNIVSLAANIGVELSYQTLVVLYAITFCAVLISYGLFYRGTVSLFTDNKFATTIFGLFAMPAFALLLIISAWVFKLKLILLYTALV